MKEIILASGNPGKLAEFRKILKGYKVVSPEDLKIDFDVDETGETFYDNALLKARALYELCGKPALADDSGLCVDALGGAPGVYSARYSGGGDRENIAKLLSELDGVKNRAAHFACCIVYYDGTDIISAEGKVYGKITEIAIGEKGFGYDPVFYSDELKKTFGEASETEKNGISHRARALTTLFDKLEKSNKKQ